MTRRATTVMWLLAASTILAGSAVPVAGQTLPLPETDRKEIDTLLGEGVVGDPLPSQPIEDASVFFPLQERQVTYLVTGGPKAGTTQTLNVAKGKRPNGEPAWRFQLSPSQNAFLRESTDGDVMMPAITDLGEGIIIISTPPNPFLIEGMKPGESRALSQSVSVNYLDDPSRQDYSGSLSGTYTYVGTYRVTVPAGSFDAILIRHAFEGKIGPAHTSDTAYYFFAANVGTVAMITQEDVEAFWVIHIDHSSGKVLASR